MKFMVRILLLLCVGFVGTMPGHPCALAASENIDVVPQFAISRFAVKGNTLINQADIEGLLRPFTGPQRDFGDVQQAVEELENFYRNRGYTMVTVLLPEQELSGGEIHLRVLEPFIAAITIDGNRHFSRENILSSLPTLRTGIIPMVHKISENLRAANENPARKINLQFKTQENPEELHAALEVSDQKPWRATVNGDNTGNNATGKYRAGLGFQHFNLFNRDHIASLQYITSPDHFNSVKIFSGSYRVPLYRFGDTLDVFGAYSDVDSGTTQVSGVDIKISGKGIISGFRYNMNLPRSGEYEQKMIGGMDYRLYDNSAIVMNQDVARDLVAHPFSLTYAGVLTTESIAVDGSLGVVYNIPWGHLGEKEDFLASRSEAAADYLIFRYNLNLTLRPGNDTMFRLALSGQQTPDRLIPGEQFGFGGSTVLRGYEEREEFWDTGWSGSIEAYTPDLAQLLRIPKGQLRFLAFFDIGSGKNLRPQAGDLSGNTIKSFGAGFRFNIGETMNLVLDWGRALEDSNVTKRGDSAVHVKFQVSF